MAASIAVESEGAKVKPLPSLYMHSSFFTVPHLVQENKYDRMIASPQNGGSIDDNAK